ncbi:MAG TPA: hypothetical protein EYQ14_04370 [Gammaproteobacteria bacterium]|nr:hypothetical protein [Gammaproteobacteria bacterium]
MDVITGFWQTQPNEGQPASQKTSVFVGYTDDTLYIGVVCYDENPELILVTDSRRDSALDDTDSFQIMLDGFWDRQNGLVFGTNPAGLEYDGQVTKEGTSQFGSGGGGFNLAWDTTWQVKARITEIGWSAEFAIPFKSLRYGADEIQTWGINFQRNIRRNNEVAYWASLERQYNLHRISGAGSIGNLRVPTQRNLKLTPYGLGETSSGGDLGSDSNTEFGFDLKYSINQSLTLDVTYNTDFAQVEVDEFQVNLDRFNLFLPEQRPFFLENAGQFAVGIPRQAELFFSRRIGIGPDGELIPIDAGVRLSGKVGTSTNVGFLQMRSEALDGIAPRNDYTVARVSRELPNRSSVGGIFVNRKGDGSVTADGEDDDDYNRTIGLDGRWGIGLNGAVSGIIAKTKTPGLSGKDHSMQLSSEYNSEKWSLRASYAEVGEDFNPEVGFLTRDDYRHVSLFALRRIRPDNMGNLQEIRPHVAYRGFWNFDGYWETGFLHVDSHWEWNSGFEIHTGVNFLHEGVLEPFEIVDGVTVEAGEYDDSELALVLFSDQSAPLSFRINGKFGGFFGGDRISLEPTVGYRIGEAFSTELSWLHNDIELEGGDFRIGIGRFRLTYSFTPKISIQALVQYNERDEVTATNLRFAWLTKADSGLYIVYNEVDDNSFGVPGEPRREFIVKYSHILDL